MIARLILKFFIIICAAICYFNIVNVEAAKNDPITTDTRIKTFVYSANEVFPIILHYGYQTAIEFAKSEKIETYSLGNTYAWQLSNVGRTLFIKPLEDNITTNMTIITNKRRYYLELQSRPTSNITNKDLAYAIRFFYPDDENNRIAPSDAIPNNNQDYMFNNNSYYPPNNNNNYHPYNNADNYPHNNDNNYPYNNNNNSPIIPSITPYNFNYKIEGDSDIAPTAVFDDGVNTYLQYNNSAAITPTIRARKDRDVLAVKRKKNYIIINEIDTHFIIKHDKRKVVITAIDNHNNS